LGRRSESRDFEHSSSVVPRRKRGIPCSVGYQPDYRLDPREEKHGEAFKGEARNLKTSLKIEKMSIYSFHSFILQTGFRLRVVVSFLNLFLSISIEAYKRREALNDSLSATCTRVKPTMRYPLSNQVQDRDPRPVCATISLSVLRFTG